MISMSAASLVREAGLSIDPTIGADVRAMVRIVPATSLRLQISPSFSCLSFGGFVRLLAARARVDPPDGNDPPGGGHADDTAGDATDDGGSLV